MPDILAPTVPSTDPANSRDLGGIPVMGGLIRPGFVLRADDLSIIPGTTAGRLHAAGLGAIIDLRSAEELAFTGRGPLAALPIGYHHLPLMSSLAQSPRHTSEKSLPDLFGVAYADMVEESAANLVAALAVIAFSRGTIAFHCAGGKDRTGVLAAILLVTLGADEDAIVADYALTRDNIAAINRRIAPVLAPLLSQHGVDLNAMAQQAADALFSEDAIRLMLHTLTERHGDPLQPLRNAGLDELLVGRLQRRALTTTP